jgi:hypothetical protein
MPQSTEILSLLQLLDEVGTTIGYLSGYVHDMDKEQPGYFRVLNADEVKDAQILQRFTSSLVKAKREPERELTDEMIQHLIGILGDEFLDEHFTILELKRVLGIVKRWKKLRAFKVVLLPGEKVTHYLRQATTCYLYGLPDAAVILCRAVLQFALQEGLAAPGGISLDLSGVDRKDYLEKLINFARNKRVLSDDLTTRAHRIRKLGNKSVHQSNCSDSDALGAIKESGEVLAHIYGRTSTKS